MKEVIKKLKKVKDKKHRMTKQRRIILEELKKVSSHPSADEIFHLVRMKIPNISFGTVYRNLRFLKKQGFLMELDYGKTFSRFDGNPQNHYHFKCIQCGKIFDVKEPVNRSLDRRISQEMGFQVSCHRLEFYGKCKECQ